MNIIWTATSFADPKKYWYDILMGFKTELLLAYLATLVFLIAVLAVRASARAVDQNHVIAKMETENERLEIEKKSRWDGEAGGAE